MNLKDFKHKQLPSLFKILPAEFKGKARLARFLFSSFLDKEDVEIIAGNKCRYLVPCLREPVGFDATFVKTELAVFLRTHFSNLYQGKVGTAPTF